MIGDIRVRLQLLNCWIFYEKIWDFLRKRKGIKKSFSELFHRFSNQVQSKEKFFFGERLARNQSTPQKFLVHILFTKFVTQSYFYNHCNSTIGTLFYSSLRGNKNGTLRTKIDKKFNHFCPENVKLILTSVCIWRKILDLENHSL